MTHLNLPLVFIFQIIDENLAVDSSDRYCVTIVTESYRSKCDHDIVTFSINSLHIFSCCNIKELNFTIVATTCQEKVVHRRESYLRTLTWVGLNLCLLCCRLNIQNDNLSIVKTCGKNWGFYCRKFHAGHMLKVFLRIQSDSYVRFLKWSSLSIIFTCPLNKNRAFDWGRGH